MEDEEKLLQDLRAEAPKAEPHDAAPRRTFGWWILLILIAPTGISLCALGANSRNYGEGGLIALLVACPIAGIIAGCLFASGLRKLTVGQRIAAGFGMSIVFTVASAALSTGGCMMALQLFSASS